MLRQMGKNVEQLEQHISLNRSEGGCHVRSGNKWCWFKWRSLGCIDCGRCGSGSRDRSPLRAQAGTETRRDIARYAKKAQIQATRLSRAVQSGMKEVMDRTKRPAIEAGVA